MQRNKKPGFGAVLFVQTYTQTSPDLVMFICIAERIFALAKGGPVQRQGGKASGSRFLCDATKNPKIAGLPRFQGRMDDVDQL